MVLNSVAVVFWHLQISAFCEENFKQTSGYIPHSCTYIRLAEFLQNEGSHTNPALNLSGNEVELPFKGNGAMAMIEIKTVQRKVAVLQKWLSWLNQCILFSLRLANKNGVGLLGQRAQRIGESQFLCHTKLES